MKCGELHCWLTLIIVYLIWAIGNMYSGLQGTVYKTFFVVATCSYLFNVSTALLQWLALSFNLKEPIVSWISCKAAVPFVVIKIQ